MLLFYLSHFFDYNLIGYSFWKRIFGEIVLALFKYFFFVKIILHFTQMFLPELSLIVSGMGFIGKSCWGYRWAVSQSSRFSTISAEVVLLPPQASWSFIRCVWHPLFSGKPAARSCLWGSRCSWHSSLRKVTWPALVLPWFSKITADGLWGRWSCWTGPCY